MADTVTISIPGISAIRAADFSLTRGITPSIGIIYALPQDGVDIPSATLSFTSGSRQVNIAGCALAAGYIHKSVSKWPIQAFHVVDRRWKWRYSIISGDYNRRLSDGTVDPATQQTPSTLASLIFQALGEIGADTSRMPTSVKPRALWKSQRADLALQDLCDKCACEVVYNHQLDNFEIWPSGLGITLPTNSGEILPKCRYVPRNSVPAIVKVVCGPSVFQSKLKLAAVVRRYSDSLQQKISASTTIPNYTTESIFSYPGVTDSNNSLLAFDQAWRDYRIIGQQDGTTQPPSCPSPVSSIDQYHLQDTLLETETDLEGYKRNLPYYVDGDYWPYTEDGQTQTSHRYTGSSKLDKDRRMVQFPLPMLKLDSSGNRAEPTLYLTTSYQVVDNTNSLVCVTRQGNVGGSGGTLILRRPEIFAIYSTTTTPGQQTNTEAQANTEADAYVQLFQAKFASTSSCEMEYPGLSPIVNDGIIAQVRWKAIHGQAPTTFACENDELDTGAVPKRRRRLDQLIEQLAEAYL